MYSRKRPMQSDPGLTGCLMYTYWAELAEALIDDNAVSTKLNISQGSARGDYLAIAHPPSRANCPLLKWSRHIVLRATSTLHYACSNRSQGLIFHENLETLSRCLAANNNPSRLHTNRLPDQHPHTKSHFKRQTGDPRRVAHSSRWGQAHRRSLDRNYIASL